MNTATLLKTEDGHHRGQVIKVYQLDPPYEGNEYVMVSAITSAFDTGLPETFIFPSDEVGTVKDYEQLPGSFQGGMDHDRAIRGLGYKPV